MEILVVLLIIWVALIWVFYQWGAGIAERKGRSRAMGGWIALLFGFIGIIVLYFMSDETTPAYIQHSATPPSQVSAELEKLASLRDRGALTQEEFEQKKRVLLR